MSIQDAIKAFEDFVDKDRKYALEHKIKCEKAGCNWIAEYRCARCLDEGLGDHWFCRPMRFIPKYYGPYAFSFEKGKPWIEYDNKHSNEHDEKVHKIKDMWTYTR